jgi:tetratricopeptide (TPR) repeat protein
MTKSNRRARINSKEFMRLLESISEQLHDVDNDVRFRRHDLHQAAVEHGAQALTLHQLEYMIDEGFLLPTVEEGQIQFFGWEELRDTLLIWTLKERRNFSYTRIATLMRQYDEQLRPTHYLELARLARQRSVGVMPQHERGSVILRSRVLGVCLSWLFNGTIPADTVVLMRRRKSLPAESRRDWTATASEYDMLGIDQHVYNIQPDDILGRVTVDGEIIFEQGVANLTEYAYKTWKLYEVKGGTPYRHEELVIGIPDGGRLQHLYNIADSDETAMLGVMLDTIRLELSTDFENDQLLADAPDRNSLLAQLVEILTQLSAFWDYCAVLTTGSNAAKPLHLVATSSRFPEALRKNITVEPGQLLSGWALQYGYKVVVQKTAGQDDPRLAHQSIEQAKSALAIPTKVRESVVNGVLYVGSWHEVTAEQEIFTPSQIKLLTVIASIIGEMIERNRIRLDAERSSLQVINQPSRRSRIWPEFKNHLVDVLQAIPKDDSGLSAKDNVHLVAVRLDNYARLYDHNPAIAQWLAEHLRDITFDVYCGDLAHFLDTPVFFERRLNSPTEFVCCVSRASISDEEDRAFRSRLRTLLNSVTIPFSQLQPIKVSAYVWSIPFRYSTLKHRIEAKGLEGVVRDIIRETEEALEVLPHIEVAHEHEKNGAMRSALQSYVLANSKVPRNMYIMRHLAKTYAAVGDFQTSLKWWNDLIELDKNARHLRRRARSLVCLKRFGDALESYEEAHRLDPHDIDTLLEWGDLLLDLGQVEKAIEKYTLAQQLASNADIFSLRLAEAFLAFEDFDQSKHFSSFLLTKQPDDPDANRFFRRALHKRAAVGRQLHKPKSE